MYVHDRDDLVVKNSRKLYIFVHTSTKLDFDNTLFM